MSRNTWDAVLASTPLNETAGRVTSRNRDAYEPNVVVDQAEWEAPPSFVPFVQTATNRNLVGHRFGRLGVVGYLGKGKWCCRCACGKYVSRSHKAATNPANAEVDRCQTCKHTAYLQREASAEKTLWRRTNGIVGAPKFKDGREA